MIVRNWFPHGLKTFCDVLCLDVSCGRYKNSVFVNNWVHEFHLWLLIYSL